MNCKDIETLLVQYDHSFLDTQQGERVRQHLTECSQCRLRLKEIQDTLQLLTKESIPQPEESFWTEFLPQVRSRIQAGEKPGFAIFPKPKLAFGLVSAVVLVALSFFLFNLDQRRTAELQTDSSVEGILSESGISSYTDQLAEILSSREEESLAIEVFLSSDEEDELELTERILDEDYLSQQGLNSILRDLSAEELKSIEKSVKALQVGDIL